MADNPIKYSDLFDGQSIKSGIEELLKDLNSVKDVLEGMKTNAETAARNIKNMADKNPATNLVSSATEIAESYKKINEQLADVNKEIETLKNGATTIKDTSSATRDLGRALDGLSKAASKASKAKKDDTISDEKLTTAFRNLGIEIEKVEGKLVTLQGGLGAIELSEKELIKIMNLGNKSTTLRANSYDSLSTKYSAMKIVINKLTDTERQENETAKKMVSTSKEMYEQMNKLQIATGKHQLSVGNYEKAFNGLNLATQQVVRELPVMAFGFDRFIMAISNNLPILGDAITNMKAYNAQQGELKKALLATGRAVDYYKASQIKIIPVHKQLLKSLLSWQTIMIVILTVLPSLIKKIKDMRKEVGGLSEEMKNALNTEKLWADMAKKIGEGYIDRSSKFRTIYKAATDMNRTLKERTKIAEVLKQNFKDETEGIDAITIANGNAEAMYRKVNNQMLLQARIMGRLDKIREIEKGKVELEIAKHKQEEWLNKNVAEGFAEMTPQEREVVIKPFLADMSEQERRKASQYTSNLDYSAQTREWHVFEYEQIAENIKKADEKIANIIETTPLEEWMTLFEDKTGKGRKSREKSLKDIKEYFWEMMKLKASLTKDEFVRDLELSEIERYEKIDNKKKERDALLKEEKELELALKENKGKFSREQIAEYENHIAEIKKQVGFLNKIIIDTETEFDQKWLQIVKAKDEKAAAQRAELFEKFKEEAKEEIGFVEDDLSITAQYEKAIAPKANKLVRSRLKLNALVEKNQYRSAKKEGKIFKEMTIEKLKMEADYQRALAKMRLETGEWTEEQYAIELSKIETNLGKSIASLNKKKRGKFNIWNIIFGKTTEDGKGNVTKELSAEAIQFTQQFTNIINQSISYMNEWMDARIEMAHIAVEAAETELEAAKSNLELEQQARANGYANNITLAKKEFEEKLRIKEEAVAEEKRLAEIQRSIDLATQISSLTVAVAELWATSSSLGPIAGPILAAIATASMFAAFTAAQVQAAKVAKVKKYGEGMSEYLDYGGSHASGNDIDFGRTKDGTQRRVERGEMIAVINKRNVSKYGADHIASVVASLNSGTFEDKYGLAFAGVGLPTSASADLSKVEGGIDTLVKQGERKIVQGDGCRIEYYKNRKRIIRS